MDSFQHVLDILDIWKRSAFLYSAAGWVLVGLSVVSGIAISTFTQEIGSLWVKILGFTTALCSALLASFSPLEISEKYWAAWRLLDQAAIEYTGIEKFRTTTYDDYKKVLTAKEQGEQIITNSPMPKVITIEPSNNSSTVLRNDG